MKLFNLWSASLLGCAWHLLISTVSDVCGVYLARSKSGPRRLMFFSVLELFRQNRNTLTWCLVGGTRLKTAWIREKHQLPRRSLLSVVLRVIVVFAGLQIAAFGAVSAIQLIPDRLVIEKLHAEVRSEAITSATWEKTRTGGYGDRYDECTTLGMHLGAPEGESWFTTVAMSTYLGHCEAMINLLDEHGHSGRLGNDGNHLRHWYGQSVVVRPALMITGIGVTDLRVLAMLALTVSVIWLAKTVITALGRWSALAVLGPIVVSGDLFGLVDTFVQPFAMSVAFAGVAALAGRASADRNWQDLIVTAFIAGSVYAFVNMVFTVPGVWAMSAGVAAGCIPARREMAIRMRRMVAVAIAWPAGYASMWAAKWVWAAIAWSPSAVFRNVTEQLQFRINGDWPYISGHFGAGLIKNLDFWLAQPFAVPVLIISVVIVLLAIVNALQKDLSLIVVAMVVASPILVVIPWQLITNNFSEIHYWCEYRSWPMVLGVSLMAICVASKIAYSRSSETASVIGSTSEQNSVR